MDIINVTCSEIQTPAGFLYVILPLYTNSILNYTNNPDCEQSWLSEDKRLMADPSDPQKLMYPVISVSSDRLVTSRCVNLKHEIICHSSGFSRVTAFRARNQTAATPNSDVMNEVTPDLQHSDRLLWILAVCIVIAVLIIILICFLWQKKKLRCFPSVFQSNDSENRDPESGVQMQLGSDQSDSLNQSVLRSSE